MRAERSLLLSHFEVEKAIEKTSEFELNELQKRRF